MATIAGTALVMATIEIWEVPLRTPRMARAESHGALRAIANTRQHDSLSLSHTDGLALVAVAGCAVGVDVEHLDGAPTEEELDELAALTLSDREERELAATVPEGRPVRWLQLWTRKEAVFKATGASLGDPAIHDIDGLVEGVLAPLGG